MSINIVSLPVATDRCNYRLQKVAAKHQYTNNYTLQKVAAKHQYAKVQHVSTAVFTTTFRNDIKLSLREGVLSEQHIAILATYRVSFQEIAHA